MNTKLAFLKQVVGNSKFRDFLKRKGIDVSDLRCYTKIGNTEFPNLDGDYALLQLKYPEYLQTIK
jgi:uroporphyrinogen-III synthase